MVESLGDGKPPPTDVIAQNSGNKFVELPAYTAMEKNSFKNSCVHIVIPRLSYHIIIYIFITELI